MTITHKVVYGCDLIKALPWRHTHSHWATYIQNFTLAHYLVMFDLWSKHL